MRLLLDTHFVLALLGPDTVASEPWTSADIFISVASLWEIAIKVRQGKLSTPVPLGDLEARLTLLGCTVLGVTSPHAVTPVSPWLDTNDPFDRILLSVCEVEGLRLVTRDRKLVGHPLAWRPAST